MNLDMIEKAGFIGAGYVVTQPLAGSPYSPITGYGTSGTLHRWDGQSFAWKGANPFTYEWDRYGNFTNGGPPAYINVIDVPGAPKDMPAARSDVWVAGPQLSVYAGQVLGNRFYGSPPWLYPIAAGEVLWLSFSGAGFADERDSIHQPEVVIHYTYSFTWTLSWTEGVKWVMCTRDGKHVLVMVEDRGYFEAVVTSVTRTDNVGNPQRLNQTRYDVQISVKFVASVFGMITPGEAAFMRPDGTVELVQTHETVESDGVIDSYQGVVDDREKEDGSYPVFVITLSQIWYRVTHSLAGKPLVTYRYGQKYVSAFTIDGEPAEEDGSGWYSNAVAVAWWEEGHGMLPGELTRLIYGDLVICGQAQPIADPDMGRPYLSSVMHVGVIEVPLSEEPYWTTFYFDAPQGRMIPDDHIIRKTSDAQHLRALSPDYIYLSDNPNDQSFFFT